ncbi:sensor histidine kinase [Streptosporangium longisporum]|uniref:sensor histidine kinase n=1 Tax=Streptosporangium longisporum TaxID=46187 RepID=UPI0031EA2D4C
MQTVRIPARIADAGVGAAVTAVVTVAIAADLDAGLGGGPAPPVAAYLFAPAFGALMLLRRRFPVLVLLATTAGLIGYYAVDFPPIGLALPLTGALYSAAEAGRWRWAAGVTVATIAASGFFRLREGDDPGYLFGQELTSAAALMIAMITVGDGIRTRRLLRAEMRHREAAAAEERERVAARRTEEERLRIARELHDVLAHTVTVISVQAAVAAEALDDDPPAAGSALEVIRQASGNAMKELRATLGLIREGGGVTTPLAPVGGLAQLERLARTTSESGLPVTVRVLGEPVAVPHVVEATAYRVVQESLTNALRHAGATAAEVVVRYGDELRVSVTDDGRGGEPVASPAAVPVTTVPFAADVAAGKDAARGVTSGGYGLRGMAERVELLGGTVRAGGGDGGFRVDVTLPLAVTDRLAADIVPAPADPPTLNTSANTAQGTP